MRIQVSPEFIGIESADGTMQVCIVSMQEAVHGKQGYVDFVRKRAGHLTGTRIRIGG